MPSRRQLQPLSRGRPRGPRGPQVGPPRKLGRPPTRTRGGFRGTPTRPRARPAQSGYPGFPGGPARSDTGSPMRPPGFRGRPTRSRGRPTGPRSIPLPLPKKGKTREEIELQEDSGRPRPNPNLSHLPRGWKGPPLSKADYRKHQGKQVQKQLQRLEQQAQQGVPKSSSGPMDRDRRLPRPIRDRVPQGGPRVSPPRGRPMGPPRGRPAGPPRGRPRYGVGVHDALGGPLKAGPRSSPRPYQGNRKSGGTVSAKKYSMNRGGKVASVRKPTRA